jgi:fatty-acyl-CoA synthase
LRSGLYVVPINRYLTAPEIAYIVQDCGAKAIVSTIARGEVAAALAPLIPDCPHRLMAGGVVPGWESYEARTAEYPPTPIDTQWMGDTMMYSSGTTGRPKGILRALPEQTIDKTVFRRVPMLVSYGFGVNTVYLSPAPLYHSAPCNFVLGTQFLGGTAVVMERFDPIEALRAIERHRVTHSQWVPTMFVRMLKLLPEQRAGFDLSSHRVAIHAAAPCPAETKRAMIDWWGAIVHEYYGASEGNGLTQITSAEWLAHPGAVGRATQGIVHICDENGDDLPAGATGLVYFERDVMPFQYHNDPAKTRQAQHPQHPTWTAIGDIGHLDADGYLYLTDRQSFMIISGGVNIYPRQIEDVLVQHPAVADVAVLGVPDADLGEAVKAVVELIEGAEPSEPLAADLLDYARAHLARYMVPRSVDFIDALPRLPTGKLYKQQLRSRYWD